MNDSPAPDAATDKELTMTRTFDAPRERVWREWTEPEAFADWYGGAAAEVPVSGVEMDVQPGGEWRAKINTSDGRVIDWHGEYVEVVEPERLVLTVTDDEPGGVYDTVTVVLTEIADGRTQMRMEQTGGHMSAEGYGRAMQGWGGFFDRMEERLSAG